MPELPEVEIFRQYFQSTALHQAIREVEVRAPELLSDTSAEDLRRRLSGRSFEAAARHGKYLFAEVKEEGWLILHFGMTGFLKYFKNDDQAPAHPRFLVRFESGYRLAYDCGRKLGRIAWTERQREFVAQKGLGPDAMGDDVDREVFFGLLEQRRGTIKGLLMNQQALAGIGNVYSDEILFQAGIRPERPVAELTGGEKETLFECLEEVLSSAIACRVGEKGWPEGWLLPRREPGRECPRCGGEIERVKVLGRSAYCCPGHQK